MAFTTDPSTSIGKVRFYLGDDTPDAGVLPGGKNFSDDQVTLMLGAAGTNVYGATVALCRLAAKRWTNAPQSYTVEGQSVNHGDRAAKWRANAEDFQAQFGLSGGVGTVEMERDDGFTPAEHDEFAGRFRAESQLAGWEHRHDQPI